MPERNEIGLDNQSIIVNPTSFWEFIYTFYKKFSYEINKVDTVFEERYFKIGMIKCEQGVGSFHTTIEFMGYDSKLILEYTNSGNEIFTRKLKKEEFDFIKEYCKML